MPVAVHTMGKVGSVSVVKALAEQGIKATHLHYGYLPSGEFSSATQLAVGKRIIAGTEDWKIITLIRKPLLRNMSAFFHSLGSYYRKDYYDLNTLKANFINVYNHGWPDIFFNKDFFPMYGKDILSVDPRELPYFIFKTITTTAPLTIIFLKLEYAYQYLNIALNEGGIKGIFSMPHRNRSTNRWYPEFKQHVRFEKSFINKLNSLDYAQWAYSKNDLQKDIERYAE